MSKKVDIAALEDEHSILFPKCTSLCKEIIRQLDHLITKEKVNLAVPMQYRAKTFLSISDKIKQGRFNVKKTLTELQDLAGIRIITMFNRDALKIAELINLNFEIVKQYDTGEKLEDTQFGYTSIHIICKIKTNWLDLPSFADFKDLIFEVQIRTLSQHSWAEASNILQYKKEDNVPKPLKRSISRISALLETVDLEFERLLIERENYKSNAKKQITKNNNQEKLNVDLLKETLDLLLPKIHRDSQEDYSPLLDNLLVLGYNDVDSLTNLIKKHLEATLKENKRICEGFLELMKTTSAPKRFEHYVIRTDINKIHKGTFFTHAGIIRYMLKLDLKEDWHILYMAKKKNVI